jgi:hypothetical protein
MAEIRTVPKKTPVIMPNNFPSFSVFSKVAIEDEIVKKINGMIAVNSKFRKISPKGFITSTPFPKSNPKMLPAKIPTKSNKTLL